MLNCNWADSSADLKCGVDTSGEKTALNFSLQKIPNNMELSKTLDIRTFES